MPERVRLESQRKLWQIFKAKKLGAIIHWGSGRKQEKFKGHLTVDTDQLRIQNASNFGISALNQKSFCNDYYVNEHKERPSVCSIPDFI